MIQDTILIHNLTIGYNHKSDTHIVARHINASLCSGELTCLLGANGVGKSTLLRTLSGFQPKLEGEIYIDNREIKQYTDAQLATAVSVVLTDKCDIYNMTVTELIGLGRSPYTGFWGNMTDVDRAMIEKAISLVKIEKLAHRMVHTLSDGERQKVMIAKALAQDTSVIYLDEPTAFLDFPSKVDMMQLLHRLSRETNKTVFLSTHDLELALQIADKVWIMDKKAGVTIGSPEDLALDGSLGRFFASEGLVFEDATGLFKVRNSFYSQLKLIGEGTRYEMMRKALARNGILAHRDVESLNSIDVGDGLINKMFKISLQEKPAESVRTIAETLDYLKSHFTAVDDSLFNLRR